MSVLARIRSIKPEFADDELLGKMSRDVRLFFILLWTQADDEGRLRASPHLLKSRLFPLDDDLTIDDIDKWLHTLHDAGRIVLYSVRDQAYAQIVNWLRHQRINRPTPSLIPACPQQFTEGSVRTHGGRSEGSLRDMQEPSLREGRGREGIGEEVDRKGEREGALSPLSADSLSPAAQGALLRNRWPEGRRGSQRAAAAAFANAMKKADLEEILRGAYAWLAYWAHDDNAAFAHEFPNWLRDERWNQRPPPLRKGKGEERQDRLVKNLQAFMSKEEPDEP